MNSSERPSTLREILDAERECCRALAEVVERERVAASTHDLASLLASNKAREATQAQWRRIADLRRSSLRTAGRTLEELAGEDGRLAEARDDLVRMSTQLQRDQRVNAGLVRAVLQSVTGLIDSCERELPTSRYGQDATLSSGVRPSGGLAFSA